MIKTLEVGNNSFAVTTVEETCGWVIWL